MGDVRNAGNLANFFTGESHVEYAALGLFFAGAAVIWIGWSKSDRNLLVLGLIVTIASAGIAVDVWAHEYTH